MQALQTKSNAIFPQTWQVDESYISTLGMKLIAGRNFSGSMGTDSTGLVINESAAKFLGFSDPVGKVLYQSADGKRTNVKAYRIVGMIKDFNFNSLREDISPVVLRLGHDMGNLSIRVNTKNLPALIAQIKAKWAAATPNEFSYYFLDEAFDKSYRAEQRIGTIFIVFSSLAILIACLGLFGLAAYAAEQRTKEIGIRKVLGASVTAIVGILSVDFVKLILIAIVIASPLAWFVMHKWLQDFAYRVAVPWYTLLIAGLAAMAIAVATISFQSVRAALMNPVKSLKSE